MSSDNGNGPDALPTATIADDDEAITRFRITLKGDDVLMILENPAGAEFALKFPIKIAAILTQLCAKVIGPWHAAHPDKRLMHMVNEASVSLFDDIRNQTGVQFEQGIAFLMPNETAGKLAELIQKQLEMAMTPEERRKALQKKSPLVHVPKSTILRP